MAKGSRNDDQDEEQETVELVRDIKEMVGLTRNRQSKEQMIRLKDHCVNVIHANVPVIWKCKVKRHTHT